jgi:hypothetical protein
MHDIFNMCNCIIIIIIRSSIIVEVVVVVVVVVVEQSVASTNTSPLILPIASSHPTAPDPLLPTPARESSVPMSPFMIVKWD